MTRDEIFALDLDGVESRKAELSETMTEDGNLEKFNLGHVVDWPWGSRAEHGRVGKTDMVCAYHHAALARNVIAPDNLHSADEFGQQPTQRFADGV